MNIGFSEDIVLYKQIEEFIKLKILHDEYKPGEKLKETKELSKIFSVNPNIIEKSLNELIKTGLIYTDKKYEDDSYFVTLDIQIIDDLKEDYAMLLINKFTEDIKLLNLRNDYKKDILNKIEGVLADE